MSIFLAAAGHALKDVQDAGFEILGHFPSRGRLHRRRRSAMFGTDFLLCQVETLQGAPTNSWREESRPRSYPHPLKR